MNKSERGKLSKIVADMIYSAESPLIMIDLGKTIMAEFPVIEDEVEQWQPVIRIGNAESALNQLLRGMADHTLLCPRVNDASRKAAEVMWDVLNHYLENAPDEDAALAELTSQLFDVPSIHESQVNAGKLVSTERWRDAVGQFVGEREPVYFFMTGQWEVYIENDNKQGL